MARKDIELAVGAVALDAGLANMRKGIELCTSNKLILSTLVLVYSGMDTLASLDRAPEHAYVQRDDFQAWVTVYLLPDSGIAASALELYAARCSLLHTFGPYSKLADEGKARSISYAWGNAKVEDLQKEIDERGRKDLVAVHVGQLVESLFRGIDRWQKAVVASPEKAALIRTRTDELYYPMDADFFRQYRAAKEASQPGGA